MNRAVLNLLTIAAFSLVAGLAIGMDQEPNIDKGKMLFNDPNLGTTGKSCNDCHSLGRGLKKVGTRQDLEEVVNSCITAALKGKALDPKSIEMRSLVLYLRSLGAKD